MNSDFKPSRNQETRTYGGAKLNGFHYRRDLGYRDDGGYISVQN